MRGVCPFRGRGDTSFATGAQQENPALAYSTISDVVLHIRYTSQKATCPMAKLKSTPFRRSCRDWPPERKHRRVFILTCSPDERWRAQLSAGQNIRYSRDLGEAAILCAGTMATVRGIKLMVEAAAGAHEERFRIMAGDQSTMDETMTFQGRKMT